MPVSDDKYNHVLHLMRYNMSRRGFWVFKISFSLTKPSSALSHNISPQISTRARVTENRKSLGLKDPGALKCQ